MRVQNLFGLFLVVLLSSCNQKKIEMLEKELGQKEIEIIELNQQLKELNQRISYLSQFEPNYFIKSLTNDEIIEIFKNHTSFYCSQMRYKNFQVVSVDKNIYDISYLSRTTESGYVQDWTTGIHRITLLPNNKYDIELRRGQIC